MHLYVASTSSIKLAAVKNAFSLVFRPNKLIVTGFPTNSGVNCQPCNLTETIRGANNRLSHLMQQITPSKTSRNNPTLVAIESGLIYENGNFYDQAVIIVVSASGQRHIGTTGKLLVPPEPVYEALRRGFDHCRFADVIAEEQNNPGIATDPHLYLTGVSRQAFLEAALIRLI